MDVTIREQDGRRAIAVEVLSPPGDQRARALARRIERLDGRIYGYASPGSPERTVVSLANVLLFEVASQRVAIVLRDGRELESPLRLFRLEEELEGTEFVRVSRQVIVNFDCVRGIRPEVGAGLILELEGGRLEMVTRAYAPTIRKKLGMER